MSIINQLASALGRRDEEPNQQLAKQIADNSDTAAVKELIDNLSNKSKDIQHDCIKAIYETGTLKPKLITPYCAELVKLLDSKNNRMQWGGMTALATITSECPDIIFANLGKLVAVAEAGSVITKDNLMAILVELCAIPRYAGDAFALYNEQLMGSLTNQLPMYAERALPIINDQNKAAFIKTLNSRLGDIEKDTKRARVEKVIKKLQK
ncbi:hypothetical protein ACFGVR_17625 [Mucilaginibacter sp. AW1-3]